MAKRKEETKEETKEELKEDPKSEPKADTNEESKDKGAEKEKPKSKSKKKKKSSDNVELIEQLKEEKDKALRAYAELENYKKRKDQETITFKKYVAEGVVSTLLPVLDSFDRACEHANHDDETVQGFILIQKQFHDALEKCHVTQIEALNQPFDPNCHEAVMQEESDKVESQMVIKELQKGYKLHDRVIRPAMVVVAK